MKVIFPVSLPTIPSVVPEASTIGAATDSRCRGRRSTHNNRVSTNSRLRGVMIWTRDRVRVWSWSTTAAMPP